MKEEKILLGYGSGGKLSHRLINDVMLKAFDNPALRRLDDSAVINCRGGRLAYSTDSYVVSPIFFPGGDIGSLAVNGTVNDLSMMGAVPLCLSLSLIIEEGLSMECLKKIISSVKVCAKEAGVNIVTGDTKVVESGAADKIFINTSGIGVIPKGINISGSNAKPGDRIILSGPIGEHGIAILNERNKLNFKGKLKTDCQPLNGLVQKMLQAGSHIHCLRDPTRGGLATTLNEIASSSGVGMEIEENKISVRREVMSACEILGLDPLYVANEGRLIAVVKQSEAQKIVAVMRKTKWARDAAVIGEVSGDRGKKVILKTAIGGKRILDMLSGEQLPRIC